MTKIKLSIKNIKQWIKVMWHCLTHFHAPIESWISYDEDILPLKHNYKIWCECGYNND